MEPSVPIRTIHLFQPLDQLLLDLLISLSDDDWQKPTLAKDWRVIDIAAHLLDGNIRNLSTSRDRYFGEKGDGIHSYATLVDFLNQLNHTWVRAMQRVSPRMLIELLDSTNKTYRDHLATLPLFEPSVFPVDWAGESESQNWFHIAREYTEKWHHQQQIREAIGGASPLFSETLYRPYLETSLRALPFYLRNTPGDVGDTFSLFISGEGDYQWHLEYRDSAWHFLSDAPTYAVTKINLDDRVIWRLFSGQISVEELNNRSHITGKRAPAEAIFRMRAVMIKPPE